MADPTNSTRKATVTVDGQRVELHPIPDLAGYWGVVVNGRSIGRLSANHASVDRSAPGSRIAHSRRTVVRWYTYDGAKSVGYGRAERIQALRQLISHSNLSHS
jgi:hypothetical protein